MIANKQLAFGKTASNKLPIGVFPIEYLESTGTQYIDTGLTLTEFSFSIKTQTENVGVNEIYMFGSGDTTSGILMIRPGRYPTAQKRVICDGVIIKKEGAEPTNYVNVHMSVSGYAKTLILFNARQPDGTVRTENGGFTCYYFSVRDKDGALVRDFIPVRKGNVGYMYDRVSGQLFGNQDTGEGFVLGPDLIDYTAKDYIRYGLVAMWDGIENAGWGVHDPSATMWKDLVLGVECTIENGEWLDNAIQLTSGCIKNPSIPVLTEIVKSGEYTIEYGGYFLPREGLEYANETAGFKIGGNCDLTWQESSRSTFWSKQNMISATTGMEYPFRYEARWGWTDSMTNHPSTDTTTIASSQAGIGQRPCVAQMIGSGGNGWSYVDGVFFNAAKVNLDTNYTSSGFALGTFKTTGVRSNMTYHFFRAYSRALTVDELVNNYGIDKARFGL